MTRRTLFIGAVALAIAFAAPLAGCKKTPPDPETEVREAIAAMETAVEGGDMGAIKDLLSETYADPKGNDKKALVSMVQFQLLRKRTIHVFSRIQSIDVEPGARVATAVVYAAAGSSPIEGIDALANVRADMFRLRISYEKPDDDWIVRSVVWKRAGAGDFSEDDEE